MWVRKLKDMILLFSYYLTKLFNPRNIFAASYTVFLLITTCSLNMLSSSSTDSKETAGKYMPGEVIWAYNGNTFSYHTCLRMLSNAIFLRRRDHPFWESLQLSFYHYWDCIIYQRCWDRKWSPNSLAFTLILHNFSLCVCVCVCVWLIVSNLK